MIRLRIAGNAGILGSVDLLVEVEGAAPSERPSLAVPSGWTMPPVGPSALDAAQALLAAEVTVTSPELASPVTGMYAGVQRDVHHTGDAVLIVSLPYGEPLRLWAPDPELLVAEGSPTITAITAPGIRTGTGTVGPGKPSEYPVSSWTIRRVVRDTSTWQKNPFESAPSTDDVSLGARAQAEIAAGTRMPPTLTDFVETWPLAVPEARESLVIRLMLDPAAIQWCLTHGGLLKAAEISYLNLAETLWAVVEANVASVAETSPETAAEHAHDVTSMWVGKIEGMADPKKITLRQVFDAALSAAGASPGLTSAKYALRGEKPPEGEKRA